MAGLSTYFADQILNEKFRDAAATKLGTVYVALYSTLPNDADSGGVELSAGNYARASIDTTNATWDAPVAGAGTSRRIQNTSAISFGTASADWAPSGTPCVGFGIKDASTAGNLIGTGSFSPSVIIQSGNPVSFAAGALKLDLE